MPMSEAELLEVNKELVRRNALKAGVIYLQISAYYVGRAERMSAGKDAQLRVHAKLVALPGVRSAMADVPQCRRSNAVCMDPKAEAPRRI